ncbi:MAG: peroxiredoxin family protein [Anaerolineales bacterium]
MYKFRFLTVGWLASLGLLLAACGAGAPTAPTASPEAMPSEEHVHTDAPATVPPATGEPLAWLDMALTDARTGVTFKLSDYGEQIVILEMMDPLCYLCRDQLKEVAAALEVVGDKAVAVSLDIGGKGETALVRWSDENGATWPVALMPTDFGQALVAEFGPQIVTPSGTPIIIIDHSGTPHATEPGIKQSATLVDLVNQWTP